MEEWPLVHFFLKKGRFWVPSTVVNAVLASDVQQIIGTPSLTMAGSRIYYIFDGKKFATSSVGNEENIALQHVIQIHIKLIYHIVIYICFAIKSEQYHL